MLLKQYQIAVGAKLSDLDKNGFLSKPVFHN
jgi:hypothetical protein